MTYQQLIISALRFILNENLDGIPDYILKDYCFDENTNTIDDKDFKSTAKLGLIYMTLLELKIKDDLNDNNQELFKLIEKNLHLSDTTPLENIIDYALRVIPLLFFTEQGYKYIDLPVELRITDNEMREKILNYVYDSANYFEGRFDYQFKYNSYDTSPWEVRYRLDPSVDSNYDNIEDVVSYDMGSYDDEEDINSDIIDDCGDEDNFDYDINEYDFNNGFLCYDYDGNPLYYKYSDIWDSVYNEGIFLDFYLKLIKVILKLIKDKRYDKVDKLIKLDDCIYTINSSLNKIPLSKPKELEFKSTVTEIYNISNVRNYYDSPFKDDKQDMIVDFFLSDNSLVSGLSLEDLAMVILNYRLDREFDLNNMNTKWKALNRILSSNYSNKQKSRQIKKLSMTYRQNKKYVDL